jgi:hypothetical protein
MILRRRGPSVVNAIHTTHKHSTKISLVAVFVPMTSAIRELKII